jgi:hypothetical protein
VVIPIKFEFSASVGFIHKEYSTVISEHAMQALLICALPIDGGELPVSRSGRYIPRVRFPDIHWLGFRTSLNVFEKGEFSGPCRELNQKEMAEQ